MGADSECYSCCSHDNRSLKYNDWNNLLHRVVFRLVFSSVNPQFLILSFFSPFFCCLFALPSFSSPPLYVHDRYCYIMTLRNTRTSSSDLKPSEWPTPQRGTNTSKPRTPRGHKPPPPSPQRPQRSTPSSPPWATKSDPTTNGRD